ncbi:MAG: hypothetical protein ABIQ31_11660 [Ferruginibacter sp.]
MKKLISLLLFEVLTGCIFAQPIEIRGKITDQNNAPLANASVIEKS